MSERLMKPREVAERLQCSVSFVYAILADGSLKYFALGKGQGGKRISEEQLAAYLNDRERGGEDLPARISLRDIMHSSSAR